TFGKPSYSSSMLLAAVSSRKPTNDLKISQFMLRRSLEPNLVTHNVSIIAISSTRSSVCPPK
ncbi:hypothetical protein KIN20_024798, partial [Parelaphostrongylus tenuis]